MLRQLEQRLTWQYPFASTTHQPAKRSVSELRRRAAQAMDEMAVEFGVKSESRNPQSEGRPKAETATGQIGATLHAPRSTLHVARPSAASIGTIHHSFLQLVSLEHVGSVGALRQEAQRMEEDGALSSEEVSLLDFQGLAAFWDSDLGRRIRSQSQFVQRELPFTARFSAQEVLELTGETSEANVAGEFIVVQGAADLAIVQPERILLVDFKSDRFGDDELGGKVQAYAPQLKLYAQALSRIYRRPVSECWLYFIARREAVEVQSGKPPNDRSSR